MSLLVTSLIKVETNELLKSHGTTRESIDREVFQSKAPLLYQLQKNFVVQSVQFLADNSLLRHDYDHKSTMIDKQSLIQKPSLNFILKLVDIFAQLLTDQSRRAQDEIGILAPLLFPMSVTNQLFDLLISSPRHQSKIIIIRLFST
jgi:hypothetical protein